MTFEDQITGWGFAVTTVAIFGLLILAVLAVASARRDAQAAVRDEVEFPVQLARAREWVWWRRRVAEAAEERATPVRHRARWQLPDWVRILAAHGARREPAGYGPPPPLVVSEPVVLPQWAAADANTVRWPSNPVRNPQPVPVVQDALDAALTVGQVLADAGLREQVRQPVSMDATQQIAPVRAEVVG